jgi:superfamily II DNA/RNA helicase
MEKFEKLGLSDGLMKIIKERGFTEPSEIQEKSIPLVLEGKDLVACAATGSGKTFAFIVKMLEDKSDDRVQALILTPTRELAVQISSEFAKFAKYNKKNVLAVYGGVSINKQIDLLRTAQVVVATPGRLLDHIERGTIDLTNVRTLVLDEADRMLDMGFIEDVERIMGNCRSKEQRQTLMFSATIPQVLRDLAHHYMNHPEQVQVKSHVDPTKLKQVYYDVPDHKKFSLLVHLLNKDKSKLVMVFCNTQMKTDFVAKNLKLNNINAMAIHGGLSQHKRSKTLKSFNSKSTSVLVCTDVAARGLDIKGVTHVYNYNLPREPKQYVHRIGRTARAGSEGIAVNLLSRSDHDFYSNVMKENRGLIIDKLKMPHMDNIKVVIKHNFPKGSQGRGNFSRGPRSGGQGPRRQGGSSGGFRGRSSQGGSGFRGRSSGGSGFRGRDSQSGRSSGGSGFRGRSGDGQGFRGRDSQSGRSSGGSGFRGRSSQGGSGQRSSGQRGGSPPRSSSPRSGSGARRSESGPRKSSGPRRGWGRGTPRK